MPKAVPAKQEVEQLRDKIRHHDYQYYVLDEPELTADAVIRREQLTGGLDLGPDPDLPAVIIKLRPLGYHPEGDLGVPDREAFTTPPGTPPTTSTSA